jgi:hypothetical protein
MSSVAPCCRLVAPRTQLAQAFGEALARQVREIDGSVPIVYAAGKSNLHL